MGLNNGYEEHLTIERNDFNGITNLKNCTWITKEQQKYNKRDSYFIERNGVTNLEGMALKT